MQFAGLNYSLANEDTAVERHVLAEGAAHVVAIAGSGARVVPLLARGPRRLTVLDLSAAQLALTRLRVEAARALSYGDYVRFFGFEGQADAPVWRRQVLDGLPLPGPVKDQLRALFAGSGWAAPIYLGKWERTFRRLSSLIRPLIGAKALRVLDFTSLSEQLSFLDGEFPVWRWNLATRLLGHAAMFQTLMYRTSFPPLNLAPSSYAFYRDALRHALTVRPARRNFFLNILLTGRLPDLEAAPDECDRQVFAGIKAGLERCEVTYVQGAFEAYSGRCPGGASFLSLSDIGSYAGRSGGLAYLGAVGAALAPAGLAACRYYRFRPEAPLPPALEDVTESYRDVLTTEMTGMYRVEILRKRDGTGHGDV